MERQQKAKETLEKITMEVIAINESLSIINTDLITKATMKEVRQCVTRHHYEQAITSLGTLIETKCEEDVVVGIHEELKVISTDSFYSEILVYTFE